MSDLAANASAADDGIADDALHPARDRTAEPLARRVAVIGAGIAGLTAARALAENGVLVSVFDKGRGPGGRTARRRQDGCEFDHGAQYFTVSDPLFAQRLESWRRDGAVVEWPGRIVRITPGGVVPADAKRRFVGADGMSHLARHLGAGLDVRCGRRVRAVLRSDDDWTLQFEDGPDAGPFDVVIVSAPAPQTAELLSDACPTMAAAASSARYAPCWTAMLAFDDRLEVDFDAAFVETSGPLRWIARNASKPGRPPRETWIANGSPAWSAAHLDDPADRVADTLVESFFDVLGISPIAARAKIPHRWRYALVDRALGAPCLYDEASGLGACGDWCLGPRVEAAFLSGAAVAARMLGTGGETAPAPGHEVSPAARLTT